MIITIDSRPYAIIAAYLPRSSGSMSSASILKASTGCRPSRRTGAGAFRAAAWQIASPIRERCLMHDGSSRHRQEASCRITAHSLPELGCIPYRNWGAFPTGTGVQSLPELECSPYRNWGAVPTGTGVQSLPDGGAVGTRTGEHSLTEPSGSGRQALLQNSRPGACGSRRLWRRPASCF